ncbi:MAG: magnesium/cobalt transporter CorA [Salinibacter sp.]
MPDLSPPSAPYSHPPNKRVGHPPGSVVFTGEDRDEPVRFSVFDYTETSLDEYETGDIDEVLSYFSSPTTTWINVDGLHEEAVIRTIGDHFEIHPLVQEDIANTSQRPKVELQDGHLYITAKMLYLQDPEQPTAPGAGVSAEPFEVPDEPALRAEHISLLVGPGYLISFQETPGDIFDPVRTRLRNGRGRIRTSGPDYLAYALLDIIVDHYFVVLETLGTWAEDLEDAILETPEEETQEKVNALRRDLIFMRRRAWPVRDLLYQLTRLDSPLWDESTGPFIRDTYDHAQQVADHIEALRDTTSGLMDLYMSALSHRMNEIMKVLTIIGTIFIPLTFVAGIYGMNFEHMPELGWDYGYFLALGAMALLAAGTLGYFRREGWL